MVTDRQVRRLMMLVKKEKTQVVAAARSGMDPKTARKYIRKGKLPSQMKESRNWRTREDNFKEIWEEVKDFLESNSGLDAKTLFQYLQREYAGRFSDGQLRTFQRQVKRWRAMDGPSKEIYFPQRHTAGDLSESDFTHMNSLGVTIGGEFFRHMLYHFVLTYSNWETVSISFSESFESLSAGLQDALWELGGVPLRHRTDRLTAAVHKECNPEEFTARYQGLLSHYGLKGEKIRPGEAHENGDVEQSHKGIKHALDQSLMLRGSRDFSSREEYASYIRKVVEQLNFNRQIRFREELKVLRQLPTYRMDDFRRLKVKVGPSSTISISKNVYSVNSRLIGEEVEVRLYAEYFEVWYGQKKMEKVARLRGEKGHRIQYRHMIDWLVRKPGAFENYRYREDLFPTLRFRMAWDWLNREGGVHAHKEYLQILQLAAKETETGVDQALQALLLSEEVISAAKVQEILSLGKRFDSPEDVTVSAVDLASYDNLIFCECNHEAQNGTAN
jgi:hypothetical protein